MKEQEERYRKAVEALKEEFADVHNKDYDHEVDRKVAKVLIPLYASKVPADALPEFYETIKAKFNGDYNAYIDACYNNSIFANEENFNKFISNPTIEAIETTLWYSTLKQKLK